jgi:hypothetical protein
MDLKKLQVELKVAQTEKTREARGSRTTPKTSNVYDYTYGGG